MAESKRSSRIASMWFSIGAGVLLLVACGAGERSTSSASQPPQATATGTGTPAATATSEATPSPSSAPGPAQTATAAPTPSPGPPEASWPLRGGGSGRASITDVRVGAAPGRNRLVIEFTAPIPAYEMTINPAGVDFMTAGKGEPVTVLGSVGVVLHVYNLDWWLDRYPSGRDLVPRFQTLREVRLLDDFEGQADFAIGLSANTSPRVMVLSGPPRLVFDFPAP